MFEHFLKQLKNIIQGPHAFPLIVVIKEKQDTSTVQYKIRVLLNEKLVLQKAKIYII